jgi:cobalt-zinc-cadmium efflux system membrane fusion protein
MIKLSIIIPVYLVAIVVFLFSCTGRAIEEKAVATEILPENIVELRADQIKLASVELGSFETRNLGDVMKVNGIISVAPQNQATICMPLGGFIKNTSLLPGNFVNAGQTLAIVENQDFVDIQQNYLEAKNKLVFAEAEFNRHTDLFKENVYSEQNLQQVTVEYKNLKTQVRSLEQKLLLIGINPEKLTEDNISSTIYLKSPIKGYLKSVNVNIGKYVSPTDVLFEVVNSEKLFLSLTLFEKDADKVLSGQHVRFYINNENEEHEAQITQTGRSVSDEKTFSVYATVLSSCANLMPGMYVKALIEETSENVRTLPSESVVSFDDKDYIFIYEKEKIEAGNPFTEYRMIEVRKGVTSGGYTGIIIPEGVDVSTAKVVVKGAYNLLSAKKNAGEMAC